MDVICVLKSGGGYDAEWVRKLRDGVARNLTQTHRFRCLSDVDVPCERIALQHDWPGWWSKIELFRPGVIEGPTLYLDLDTVITGPLDEIAKIAYPFAALRNFHQPDYIGSGVMWFRDADAVPHRVYEKFMKQPDAYMAHHERVKVGSHLGDQAFIWDTLGGDIPFLTDEFKGVYSYKYSCKSFLPEDARIVAFHGAPRLHEVKAPWIERHWNGA